MMKERQNDCPKMKIHENVLESEPVSLRQSEISFNFLVLWKSNSAIKLTIFKLNYETLLRLQHIFLSNGKTNFRFTIYPIESIQKSRESKKTMSNVFYYY